jgi:hypothetical protein
MVFVAGVVVTVASATVAIETSLTTTSSVAEPIGDVETPPPQPAPRAANTTKSAPM